MKFWLSEFTLFSQWLNIMLRFGRPVFPEITGKTKKTASLQQVHGFLSIDAPGQSVSEPEPSQSPTQWVCDGKGKTRSPVDVAVFEPPHDLAALL